MKKYRCLWCLSTKNHNILYFVYIAASTFQTKGICLWKARKRLAGRGFRLRNLPKIRCKPRGLAIRTCFDPSLVLSGTGNKGRKWCNLGGNLCELWRFGANFDQLSLWRTADLTARSTILMGASADAGRGRSEPRWGPGCKTQRACRSQTCAIQRESNRRIGQWKDSQPEARNNLPAWPDTDLSAAIPRFCRVRSNQIDILLSFN